MKHKIMRYTAAAMVLAMLFLTGQALAQTNMGTTVIITNPNLITGRDLSVGATGNDVVLLQGLMIELGFLTVPPGVPLGYYGPLTRSAVARYQATRGVINTGYFGPLTKQAMAAHFGANNWLHLLWPTQF